MNIAIVGAGIVGLSTALELARDGHQVTLYEQLNAVAEATSFAPGGWLLPATLCPLAAPGCGMEMARLRAGRHPAVTGSALPGSTVWRWLRQWKQAEKDARDHPPGPLAHVLHQLAQYSQSVRWSQCADPETHAERRCGAMVLLRTAEEVTLWRETLSSDPDAGTDAAARLLDANAARQHEPGLGEDAPLHAAVFFPTGESINGRLWSQHLRQELQALGVRLWTGVSVQRIHTHPVAVQANGQNVPYEAVVLCTGADMTLPLTLDLRLPLMHVAGYSVSAPVRDALHAPRAAVLDWSTQIHICRLGQRVRVTAGAELGSNAQAAHNQATLARMYQHLNDWFPGGCQLSYAQVQIWRGTRAILPDGLPVTGRSVHEGIWFNLAHGSHGLSLAAGCARILANQIAQRPCPSGIDHHALRAQRFR